MNPGLGVGHKSLSVALRVVFANLPRTFAKLTPCGVGRMLGLRLHLMQPLDKHSDESELAISEVNRLGRLSDRANSLVVSTSACSSDLL